MKVISYIRQSNSNIISQELFPIEQKDRVIGKFKIEYDNECESKSEYTKRYSDYLEECLDDELVFEMAFTGRSFTNMRIRIQILDLHT